MGFFGVFEGKKSGNPDALAEGKLGEGSHRRSQSASSSKSSVDRKGSKHSGRGSPVGEQSPVSSTSSPVHKIKVPRRPSQDTPPARFTMKELEETMEEVAEGVKNWDEGHFTMVKNLQDAIRNHGRVDLMRMPASEGGALVAVKRMPNRWVRRGPQDFKEQYPTASERPWYDLAIVRHLNKLNFPYVCDLLGVFRDQENSFVVTSLATEGDLFAWCDHDPRPGKGREAMMLPLVAQIFSAIRWLHDVGIAHRDLSLENILLNDVGGKMHIKIIDFGMSTLSQKCRREVRGKQSYQAPEMHLDPEYDAYITDAFALGVVLFAMAAQDYPWTSTKRNACQLYEYVSLFGFRKFLEKRRLRKGNGEHLIQVFSPSFMHVLDGLLEAEPKERLTLGEACYKDRKSVWEMEWLAGVEPVPSADGAGRLAGG